MARILIVDDEEMDRVLLSEILQQAGHETLFAPDGNVALRIWKNSRVDLVVTDIVMPELNGLELLEALKREDPRVRIIAISGITARRLNEAARAGAMAILVKPIDPEELVQEITRALEADDPLLTL